MKTIQQPNVPPCDICGKTKEVVYDIPTRLTSWAYVCQGCRPKVEVPISEIIGFEIRRLETCNGR